MACGKMDRESLLPEIHWGHFGKVCSIAISNPRVAIILWFIASLTKNS